jgi:Xaa-Pro aminopeptidase
MAHLISNLKQLNKDLGGDIFKQFLSPNIMLDAPLTVIPFILRCSDRKYLLYKNQENGNCDLINTGDLIKRSYSPYFLIDKKQDNSVKQNFLEVLKEILLEKEKEKILDIDDNLPYAAYNSMKEGLKGVTINYKPRIVGNSQYKIYEINVVDIEGHFKNLRNEGQKYANRLISNWKEKKLLEKEMSKGTDSRFELLNKLMKKYGFSAVIMNSDINIQELTGFSFGDSSHVSAIYKYDDNKVYILSEKEINKDNIKIKGEYPDYFSAFLSLNINKTDNIGFEDRFININEFDYYLKHQINLCEGTLVFREWREYRAGEDLVFYIIAGKASNYAMGKVLNEASKNIQNNYFNSEEELFKKYLDYFEEFRQENKLPYHFREYFTNLYASDRTLYPSIPSKFKISKNTNEIKIDAGILMTDSQDMILGTTDIARTLPLNKYSAKVYDMIKDTIKDKIIPSIRKNKSYEQIYSEGIKFFSNNCEHFLKDNHLCPQDFDINKDYTRDIGHLMGKQESIDVKIYQGNKNKLTNDIVGCIEIHWYYDKHALVYEDMWYLGEDGVVNITG